MKYHELADAIALLQAKARCGDSVYMDGSHNPTQHEIREAQWLVGVFKRNREEDN